MASKDKISSSAYPRFTYETTPQDQQHKPLKPLLRFIVTQDFPPFSFLDDAGKLSGFHIDLIQKLCADLKTSCTMQVFPFANVKNALLEKQGDIALSGLTQSANKDQTLFFTQPYYRYVGRFIMLSKKEKLPVPGKDDIRGFSVGVLQNSAHEKYLKDYFSHLETIAFASLDLAYEKLQKNDIDYVFADHLALAFWMSSFQAKECCRFTGGVFHNPAFFGKGLMMALRQDHHHLTQRLNKSLSRLQQEGAFIPLFERYFPVNPYENWQGIVHETP